jgi:hypothetical protein
MNPILSLHTWVSLPNEVRYRIRAIFNIPRSSNTVVNDGVIETDGTTNEDFKALTVYKMQEYLDDTSTDFHKLFDKVVARVNDELSGKVTNAKPKTNGKKNK